ncbi:MAG TPA: GNAT family N-acetyltransferase [Candidatus Eisenbacteria bacterium]|jgi:FemAB-related protein (PEP-CTERM system-associated)
MTEVRPFQESDAERWDAYVRAAPDSHFGQLVAWMRLVERQYPCRATYSLALRHGRVSGILPLFLHRGAPGGGILFSAPGGLLADDEESARALIAAASGRVREEGLRYLELRDQRRRWDGLVTVEEHATLELTLAAGEEEQWRGFDAKLRNQIRKGQRSGFEARWGADGLAAFHRVLLENMRDLGTPIRARGYFRDALERMGSAATVLVLYSGREPAGAMFLVEHRDGIADPWASSLRRFFDRCPNQVLYWEAIRYAIGRGLKRFDFGRSQWDSPTFRFKAQWGARPVPLHYQYVLGRAGSAPTLEAQKHGLGWATAAWRRLPLPVARALGEPLRRLFPEAL